MNIYSLQQWRIRYIFKGRKGIWKVKEVGECIIAYHISIEDKCEEFIDVAIEDRPPTEEVDPTLPKIMSFGRYSWGFSDRGGQTKLQEMIENELKSMNPKYNDDWIDICDSYLGCHFNLVDPNFIESHINSLPYYLKSKGSLTMNTNTNEAVGICVRCPSAEYQYPTLCFGAENNNEVVAFICRND